MEKLKSCRRMLPYTKVERVLRLAGLDDGAHLGECEQFERDARVYPALEAAALGYSYLPEKTARRLAQYVGEELGVLEGPTYCHVCGTRDKGAFDPKKSVDACAACYEECGPPESCAQCGKATYDGDWLGRYVWSARAAEEGKCAAGRVGQALSEEEDKLLIKSEAEREGLVKWKNERYVCDQCAGMD